jgi:amino acid transporter
MTVMPLRAETPARGELRREIGATSAVMITVGAVIGSGIFLKPLDIAKSLPSPFWIHLSWIAIGVVCLFGALALAELGTMFPEAGGMYAFLREGWGPLPAFLYGWCFMLVISTGSIAALAVAFASSLSTMVPMGEARQSVVAVAMIAFLALVNHFGVGWGALLQNVATLAKLAALGAIVAAAYLIAGDARSAPAAAQLAEAPESSLVAGLVAASVAIFWAYEGWYVLPFNAAELRRPERDLPRGLVWGTSILVATYVSVNAAYLRLVPFEEMRAMTVEADVPKTAIERALGGAAGDWLAALICLSVFGATNPALLSNSRAFYAMARDGMASPILMRVHAVHGTPTVAIWAQATWSAILVVVLQTFRDLTEYVVFASLIFFAMVVSAVYRLRRRLPHHPRPFRCIGYPVTPALFIAAVVFVDVYTLLDPRMRLNAMMGLAILAAGVVVYRLRFAGAPRES